MIMKKVSRQDGAWTGCIGRFPLSAEKTTPDALVQMRQLITSEDRRTDRDTNTKTETDNNYRHITCNLNRRLSAVEHEISRMRCE